MAGEVDASARQFSPANQLRPEKPESKRQRKRQPLDVALRLDHLQRALSFFQGPTARQDNAGADKEHWRHRDWLPLLISEQAEVGVGAGDRRKHHRNRGEYDPHRDAVTGRRELPLPVASFPSIPSRLLTIWSRKLRPGTLFGCSLSACDHCGHYRLLRPPNQLASQNHWGLPARQTHMVRDGPSV